MPFKQFIVESAKENNHKKKFDHDQYINIVVLAYC